MPEFSNLGGISDGLAWLAVSGAHDGGGIPAAGRASSVATRQATMSETAAGAPTGAPPCGQLPPGTVDTIVRGPAASALLYVRVASTLSELKVGAGPPTSRDRLEQALVAPPRLLTAQLTATGENPSSIANRPGANESGRDGAPLRADWAAAVAGGSNDAGAALVASSERFTENANLPALIANALVPTLPNADQCSKRRRDEQRRQRHPEPGVEPDCAEESQPDPDQSPGGLRLPS